MSSWGKTLKRKNLYVSALLFGLLMLFFATPKHVSGQSDFSAFSGSSISDSQIDGTLGSEWDDAGKYNEVEIDPSGTAEIWVKHDGTYVYIAVRFTADSNNPWISFLLGGTTCMTANADGALFGNDGLNPDGYVDISFRGVGAISEDTNQNGKGAINVESSNLVTAELKKPLNSGDSAGKDIDWIVGTTYTMIVMWDSDGGGSSGGTANHRSGTLTARTILINSSVIPEFSNFTLIIILVGVTITVILFKRRSS